MGRRKCRRAAKAAVSGVVGATEHGDGGFDQVFGRFVGRCLALPQVPDDGFRSLYKCGAVAYPFFMNDLQKCLKADYMSPAVPGEVGSSEEGFLIWRHEDAGGLAIAAGEGLTDCHVDAVHIRALFSVYLDGDEISIQ